ncbi:MAG: DUF4156 domain-containing protein [Wenzhouxiangella sp.]
MNLTFKPALLFSILFLASCTWVQPEPGTEHIRLMTAEQVTGCEALGQATTSVRDRVAGVQRKPGKVEEELATLARNSAYDMGGNVIVRDGPVHGGQQRFKIYDCQ